ncbi:PREDICTED: phosphatidylinositol-binding clathrin assembly protein-like, partial [Rhinopithecus bieti]|uniref:phosphatidylinositol-binding clathrin assembly protein-like n=1 Tax=Rhinopithecus bieti TaxID=61621 RepID=UPI00083BF4F1
MGLSASKAALRATTNEPTDPEPKQLADLIQHINETNMSVEHLPNVLSEKTRSSSWVVVFKALVTIHHLMVHGNERFIKHVSCRSSLFTLHNFLDKSVIEDKYFYMRKNQCRESLDIYIKFLGGTTKLTQFLKVAESFLISTLGPGLSQYRKSFVKAFSWQTCSLDYALSRVSQKPWNGVKRRAT